MYDDLDRAELERRLATRIAELEGAHRRIEELMEKEKALRESKRKLAQTRQQRDDLRNSLEYRLGRKLVNPVRKLWHAIGGKPKREQQNGGGQPTLAQYHEWFLKNRATPAGLESMCATSFKTRFGIVLRSADDQTVKSLNSQVYPHWELNLGKTPENAREAANKFPGVPDFIAFLDPGNWLEPDAFFRMAEAIDAHPEVDILYSDEDHVEPSGRFTDPFFKPGWSPDFLLSGNYFGNLTFIRRELVEQFPEAQGYDLLLKVSEKTDRILSVPKVLHHSPVSRIDLQKVKEDAEALRAALARRNISGEVIEIEGKSSYRVKRAITKPEKIAIIIPNRDRLELLSKCVESISSLTDYPNYEIIIADNDSQNQETKDYYKTLPHRIVPYPGPFNFSAINNYAVRQTDAPWILFLNNDIEVINPGWLSAMAEHVQRPEVGAVGAKLIFPTNTIQHAGVLLTERLAATHAFNYAPEDSWENGGQIQLICNYSAVTAGCLLTRREVFEKLGGFDEHQFAVAYNDVDFCLKMRADGLGIVYTPFAQLYHYESASRGRDKANPFEKKVLRERWGGALNRDPLTNPNLAEFNTMPPKP